MQKTVNAKQSFPRSSRADLYSAITVSGYPTIAQKRMLPVTHTHIKIMVADMQTRGATRMYEGEIAELATDFIRNIPNDLDRYSYFASFFNAVRNKQLPYAVLQYVTGTLKHYIWEQELTEWLRVNALYGRDLLPR